MTDEWISVEERLPKANDDVLVYAYDSVIGTWFVDMAVHDGTEWIVRVYLDEPTHWRPLPAPPDD